MGLRPPIVRRRPAPPAAPSPPSTSSPRVVRPTPERTEPLRTADTFLRREKAPPPAAPAGSIGDAVSKAYRVFDAYVDEGKAFAAGQSGWYDGQGASTPGDLPPELASAALSFFEQMKQLGDRAPAAFAPTPPPSRWPLPRWPTSAAPSDTRDGGEGRWVDETFDDATPRR